MHHPVFGFEFRNAATRFANQVSGGMLIIVSCPAGEIPIHEPNVVYKPNFEQGRKNAIHADDVYLAAIG